MTQSDGTQTKALGTQDDEKYRAVLEKTVRHVGEFMERVASGLTLDSRIDVLPGMDSLKTFELMLYLEDCFDVKFDESAFIDLHNMRDVVVTIDRYLSAKA
jgi:acyl carrier protein